TVRFLLALARLAETRSWLFFAAICLSCGWGRMHSLITRHLDHDEIFTFYIAQSQTLRQLFKLTHTVDLHPPLSYLLVRMSFAIFGVSAWSCRLPFLLCYLVAAGLLFYLLSRLLSPLFGLITTLFLWSTPYAYLAGEARPYAMLLCFTSLMLVSWRQAVEREGLRHRWALAGLAAGGFGLLLSHILGVLAFAAFITAELIRLWIRRKPDWHLWIALLVPVVCVLTYLPLIRTRSTMLFADEYHVTTRRMVSFYWESIRYVVTPLVFIALLALLWPVFRKQPSATSTANPNSIRVPFGFLLAALSLMPLAIGILFARTSTAFFDRYGVVWLIPFAVVPAIALAYATQCDRLAATATALFIAVIFFFNSSGKAWIVEQVSNLAPARAASKLLYVLALPPMLPPGNPPIPSYLQAALAVAPSVSHLDAIDPQLPVVANTGLTFMELDREESAQVALRLYMLTDEVAASTIAHDTVFAHYEQVVSAFPIRGKIEDYCNFVSAHPRFVVVGAYNNPQGWLLRKLDQDGAELHVLGICQGYSEECQIYEISVQRGQCEKPSRDFTTSVR
ncbi:MAG TPA: glycosyltransferase family 39 protein, partial [Terriglobales bacterium]|nr:glycosyltransferase family 39 protein [Terriglobales bacterium]